MTSRRRRKAPEVVTGRYTAMPHAVLDSVAFMGASHRARSLLFELLRQHNGSNNGHLHLATAWLRRRGWRSMGAIQRAKIELLSRNLIVKTKQGGLGLGPDLFAMTWLDISDTSGLDIGAYHAGAWKALDLAPAAPKKTKCHSNSRNGTVPPAGMVPFPHKERQARSPFPQVERK